MSAETAHAVCDRASGWLIYFMVIFSPWAFGTTEPWSINVMNTAGFVLGGLFLAKTCLRRFQTKTAEPWGAIPHPARGPAEWLIHALAALTVALLAWFWVSAWNGSAVYSAVDLQFTYRDYVRWLPHSLDANHSWPLFWDYAALACFFWAARDWLLVPTARDKEEKGKGRRAIPEKLKRLIWLLVANGALLGIEGIVQRLEGSGKLLFLVQPPVNKGAESQFGPYAYRSNAAQYFNLIWPAGLGLWCLLHRRRDPGKPSTHHLLLSGVMIMAACPLVSDSRGGAIVAAGSMAVAGLLLVLALPNEPWFLRFAPGLFAIGTVVLGLNLGWDTLSKRMTTIDNDLGAREQTYNTARKIAADYPWLGTGPGTFDPVFQLYRSSPDEYWPGQLHNDWLETRVTFGGVGFAISLCALILAMARWWLPGGIPVYWALAAFLWLGIGGCLLHARFDFPLQIYSVLFAVLLNCAILSVISRKA